MKYSVYTIIMLLLLVVGCTEQNSLNLEPSVSKSSINVLNDSLYYYYHGKKTYLAINPNKYYIISQSSNNLTRTVQTNEGKIISKDRYQHSTSTRTTLSNLVSLPNVTAVEYVVGDSIPLSNLFYIKLKNKSDFSLLEQEAKKINCNIERIMESDSTWVRLSNNKNSVYPTSLEASNHLFETGLFADVDPGFIIPFKNNETPSDPYYSSQWGLKRNFLNLAATWNITKGKPYITTAIIDGGIYTQHPDLVGRMHPYSYKCSEISSSKDHGTMIAGIIAANHNSIGVAGVAPKTKLMDISCSMKATPTFSEELANGVNKAWQNGADILNLSLGDQGGALYSNIHSAILESALSNALTKGRYGKGCVVIFASGNFKVIDYPAYANEDFLVVGAIDENGNVADFSGRGKELDVVAPGVNILSTNASGGYTNWKGTSFAAPYAAGLAALILSQDSTLTQQQVCALIKESAKNTEWNSNEGYGCINTYTPINIFEKDAFNLTGPYGRTAFGQTTFKLQGVPSKAKVSWSSEAPFLTVISGRNGEVTVTPSINEISKTGNIKATIVFGLTTFNYTKEIFASNEPKIFGVEKFWYVIPNDPNVVHLKATCADPRARITWSSDGDIRDFMFAGDASFKDQPSAYATLYVPKIGEYRYRVKVIAKNKYSSDEYDFVVENGEVYASRY